MQLGLIGDDRDNSEWLAGRLSNAGFIVRHAGGVQEIVRTGLGDVLSLLVLDLAGTSAPAANHVMPLRKAGIAQPLLVLNIRSDWREKVDALDAGADDYVIKPVRSEEIVARLHAIIRRNAGGHSNRLELGDLTLDLKARCAWLGYDCLDLTRNEFRLLRLFLFQPERLLSLPEIRSYLYPPGSPVSENAVEVQIARLRRKIGHMRIKTVRGIGYRYIPDNSLDSPVAQMLAPCRSPR